jgi:hypothetical protein
MIKSDVTPVSTRSSSRVFLTSAALLTALISQSAAANVLTAPLNWQSMSIEVGLDRLKEQFLDLSVRKDTEFVGAVLRTPAGTYEFTHGNGKPGQDRVSFRIQRPADAEIVGLWHTHGAHGPTRAIFSPTDAELVRQTGLPFYLITPEGEVRVLRPEHVEGRSSGSRMIKGAMSRLPRGSHPGERVSGRSQKRQAANGCADVIEV